MPDKKFLEEYPLYRRFHVDRVPTALGHLDKVSINMLCGNCRSHQTFNMVNEYYELAGRGDINTDATPIRAAYRCSHCHNFRRYFYVLANVPNKWFMKVGQFPPWDIKGNADIERLLDDKASYYKNGLICESQGYGIGAFGYYRRIVEEIIDDLLQEISDIISGEDLEKYEAALAEAKKTTIAQEKIDLVKDLLPPTLRPDGMNPLSLLHSSLSEGLHAQTDGDCLESAAAIREVMAFLAGQVTASKERSKNFTEGMRKLLDKKSEKDKK